MDNASYTTLTRQSGLWSELRIIANNIANADTTGYRAESVDFSEYVTPTDSGDSVSMAVASVSDTNTVQGTLEQTGGAFDLAIEGDGYFLIETPEGQRLTRAGNFSADAAGNLVTPDGYPVLDAGGSAVFVPGGTTTVGIGVDGTISADGQPIGQIGLFLPENPLDLVREQGVRFASAAYVPTEGRMLQGHLESSNVDPVVQVARMIEVQRAYELGQSFLDNEHTRIRGVIDTLGRR